MVLEKTLESPLDCTEIKPVNLKEMREVPNNSVLTTLVLIIHICQRNFCDLLVKAMVFPVVMYRCESWNVKKAKR